MKNVETSYLAVGLTAAFLITCCPKGAYGAEAGLTLKGQVSAGPPQQYSMGYRNGMVLVPSPAGPALVRPTGELVGTINMQDGLPLGTLVVPSAIGPLVIGPRGEMRGTVERFKTGRSTPLIGMGPVVNYSAVDSVAAMRALFTAGGYYPLPAPVAVMPLGSYDANGRQQAVMPIAGRPQVQTFARVIRRGLERPTEENRLIVGPRLVAPRAAGLKAR